MRARHREEGKEAGFATLVGIGLTWTVLALGLAGAAVVSVAGNRHAVEAAADVAALSAAKHALEGQPAACAMAKSLAARNGASLVACYLDGLDAVVVLHRRLPGRLAVLGAVTGRARAGRER